MPSKHVVRQFYPNSFYHIYNRGVEKRDIFLDDQDYSIFIYYLFIYLSPPNTICLKYPYLPIRLRQRNLHNEIKLLCYCLMPNHFHLLFQQTTEDGVSKIMKQISNAYTQYFNQKYKRVGGLFQGVFKSVLIENDEQLLYLSHYIHLNPIKANLIQDLENYKWSSYHSYTKDNSTLCDKSFILNQLESVENYKKSIQDQINFHEENILVNSLTID